MSLVYPNMKMSEVVIDNPSLIPVISRFGIRLGLGELEIDDVCRAYGLDTDFMVALINTFLFKEYFPEKKLQTFNISLIIEYLTKTNTAYVRFLLPNIERHLHPLITTAQDNPSLRLMEKLFHSLKTALIQRIEEDQIIWNSFCEAQSQETLSVRSGLTPEEQDIHQNNDENIEALLSDLKHLMVKHLTGDYDDNLCYAVIFSICSLEKDLQQHNRIRHRILLPLMIRL